MSSILAKGIDEPDGFISIWNKMSIDFEHCPKKESLFHDQHLSTRSYWMKASHLWMGPDFLQFGFENHPAAPNRTQKFCPVPPFVTVTLTAGPLPTTWFYQGWVRFVLKRIRLDSITGFYRYQAEMYAVTGNLPRWIVKQSRMVFKKCFEFNGHLLFGKGCFKGHRTKPRSNTITAASFSNMEE
jgi:hypothetical protein